MGISGSTTMPYIKFDNELSTCWLLLLQKVAGVLDLIYGLLLNLFHLCCTFVLGDSNVLDHLDVAIEEKFILSVDLNQLLDHEQGFLRA